jgi:hypothetical protein
VNVNHMAEAVLVTGARVAIAHGEQEQAENDAFDALACVMRIEAHPSPRQEVSIVAPAGGIHLLESARCEYRSGPHIAGLDPNPRG